MALLAGYFHVRSGERKPRLAVVELAGDFPVRRAVAALTFRS